MPDRWPPMVGVVGFDGGYRPAIALTLPPGELTSDEGEEAGGGPAVGACCLVDNSCEELTEAQCVSVDGTWQGPETDCDPNPCVETPTGACCIDGECSILSESDCTDGGGIYQGDDTDCDPNPCVVTGACCVGFECTQETAPDCADLGGIFSAGIPCDPTPCCTYCDPLVWEGCVDGDGNCRTGPENCDGCAGEIVPCDETFYWFTDIEYCITCPGSGLVECNRLSINLATCEETHTCVGETCCECPSPASGSTHQMADRGFPCGACCIDGECSVLPEIACTNAGGTWVGVGTNCLSSPCGMSPFADTFFQNN